MLSVDLWHLFAPVLAGSLAALGMGFVHWLTRKSNEPNGSQFLLWFKLKLSEVVSRKPEVASTAQTANSNDKDGASSSGVREFLLYPVLACAVFGLGVVLDTAVDDLVDGEPTAAAPVRWIGAGLPRENELRFSAMFSREYGERERSWWAHLGTVMPMRFDDVAYSCDSLWADVSKQRYKVELSGLGDELMYSREAYAHFLKLADTPWGEALDRQVLWCPASLLATSAVPSCGGLPEQSERLARTRQEWTEHCKLARRLANKLYYDAANYVRRDPHVSSELHRWQAQKGLLGATHIVCALLLVIGLIALTAKRNRARRSSIIRWLGFFFIGAWFSAYAFTISSRNYIERTLGIYSSAIHNDKELDISAGRRAMRSECNHFIDSASVYPHLWETACGHVLAEGAQSTARVANNGPVANSGAKPCEGACQSERDEIYSLLAYAIVLKDWQPQSMHEQPGERGHNIGSVLVDPDGNVVFWARNSNAVTDDASQHGEVRLIRSYLVRTRERKDLKGYTVYTTLEPCAMCTGMMSLTSVKRAVWGQDDPGFGDAHARLAMDVSKPGTTSESGRYPRLFESDPAPTAVRGQLEAAYAQWTSLHPGSAITDWLRTDEARRLFEQARRALRDYQVRDPHNGTVLQQAQMLEARVPEDYVPFEFDDPALLR